MKEIKLKLVAFHITDVCTHKCAMCYYSASKVKGKHASLESLLKVSNILVKENIDEVTFLGGDPAKHPNIIDVSKYFSENGIVTSVLSNTHGYEEKQLDDAIKYISNFETTIHSDNPTSHDLFCRSKGAYRAVIERLKYFSENKKTIGIAINVTPETCSSIYKMVKNLIEIEGISLSYVIMQRIVPLGRATGLSNFALTRDNVIDALKNINLIEKNYGIRLIIEDPVPLCILPDDLQKYIASCEWGFTKASINSKGDLSRCGADPRYRLGNIFETPLSEIWQNSPILKSFRSKHYLPGRCQSCQYLAQCGGGCPLSCEIDEDHGQDYLYKKYVENDRVIHGELSYTPIKKQELSSALQIEWANFAEYGHMFSVEDIKTLYEHNPSMFHVVKDRGNWVLGYAVVTPISKKLHDKILLGHYSSLITFPQREVLRNLKSDYFHIEVIATIYGKKASRAGSFLIREVGKFLIDNNAKFVTASPIKDIGVGLCEYFGFKHVADEFFNGETYPIYKLAVDPDNLIPKLDRF